MERQALRKLALSTLRGIASEIGEDDLASNRPLRQQVDLDSMTGSIS